MHPACQHRRRREYGEKTASWRADYAPGCANGCAQTGDEFRTGVVEIPTLASVALTYQNDPRGSTRVLEPHLMQTIVLETPGRLVLADTRPPSEPGPGEVLVRVDRVGICGTDLHAFHGRQPYFSYPRILGHELGVEVLALGP